MVDETLTPVPDGTPGELLVRGHQPYAFSTGYLGDPWPAPDSWRRTGDRVVREPSTFPVPSELAEDEVMVMVTVVVRPGTVLDPARKTLLRERGVTAGTWDLTGSRPQRPGRISPVR